MTYEHAPLDLDFLKSDSPINSLFFFPTCESTNTEALNWAKQHVSENTDSLPALFITQQQTDGRGRGSHSWYSSAGALTFSLLMKVPKPTANAVSALVGIAVCEAIDQHLTKHLEDHCQLKWPNDVFLGGKKLGGILIESPLPDIFVIGIGLNVNNSSVELPESVSDQSISIIDTTGIPADINGLLVSIIQNVHEKTSSDGSNLIDISAAWQERCMFYGTTVCLESGSDSVSGKCHGVASNGAILIETNGEIVPFVHGTIRHVKA